MSTDRDAFKRLIIIFTIVFTLMCALCHRLFEDSFYVIPGVSALLVPLGIFLKIFVNIIILAVPSVLLSGIIYAVLPAKWGGDG